MTRPRKPAACSVCGTRGHNRATCEAQVVPRRKRPERVAVTHPPRVFVPPTDHPWHLAVSGHSHDPGETSHRRVWRHVVTGEEIRATWPPFTWDDCMAGAVVLRHLRDADQLRAMEPTADVVVVARAA